jgi:hypothetical protein
MLGIGSVMVTMVRAIPFSVAWVAPCLLFAQSKGRFARPPDNTADALPDGVGWFLVLLAAGFGIWLYSITPRRSSSGKRRPRR